MQDHFNKLKINMQSIDSDPNNNGDGLYILARIWAILAVILIILIIVAIL